MHENCAYYAGSICPLLLETYYAPNYPGTGLALMHKALLHEAESLNIHCV